MINENKFFEFWYDEINEETSLPNYYLIVIPDQEFTGMTNVLDPQKNNEIIFRGRTYEETSNWLLEDEFYRVMGREVFGT